MPAKNKKSNETKSSSTKGALNKSDSKFKMKNKKTAKRCNYSYV